MSKEHKSQHKAKVIITKELASQIQYMHHRCNKNTEWSALLVYQITQGSIEDLTNLIIRAEALFPMDFGDATFTSFEGDENWLKAFAQYPQIDPINPQPGWFTGKVHSHHNMGTFHSQTDKNDLYENAPKLPIFLSLIVNYATDTDCQIAIAMEVEEVIFSKLKWKLKGWKTQQKKMDKKSIVDKQTYIIDCDVEYEQDGWMKEQCDYLKNKHKPVTTTWTSSYPSYNGVGYQSYMSSKESTVTEKDDDVNKVRKFVSKKVMDNISDLVTLGEAPDMPFKDALSKVDLAVSVNSKQDYKKAIKIYFINYWYDSAFYNMATDPEEVIQSILNALNLQNGWIVTTLKESINEFKKEYTELWKVQESSVVR